VCPCCQPAPGFRAWVQRARGASLRSDTSAGHHRGVRLCAQHRGRSAPGPRGDGPQRRGHGVVTPGLAGLQWRADPHPEPLRGAGHVGVGPEPSCAGVWPARAALGARCRCPPAPGVRPDAGRPGLESMSRSHGPWPGAGSSRCPPRAVTCRCGSSGVR